MATSTKAYVASAASTPPFGDDMGYFFGAWIICAWITHIVVCLGAGKWGFLVAGALLFPIAWIHGTGIWLGFF